MAHEDSKFSRTVQNLAEPCEEELGRLLDSLGFPHLAREDIEKETKPGGAFEGYRVGETLNVCLDRNGRVLYVTPYIPLTITSIVPNGHSEGE